METATQQTAEVDVKEAIRGVLTPDRTAPVTIASGGQYTLAANVYRKEHLLNLTPVEVIKKLYDTAILGCKKKDYALAQRAITELIVGLNFDYEDMAVGLFRLYQYAKDCIRKGDIAEATTVLEELRSAWVQAFDL